MMQRKERQPFFGDGQSPRTYNLERTPHESTEKDMRMKIDYDLWSWGSSVSIVSDYRLVDRGSVPGTGKGFFL
jgi:hypothetical protein